MLDQPKEPVRYLVGVAIVPAFIYYEVGRIIAFPCLLVPNCHYLSGFAQI